ncbi:MAG: hypothetical protein V5A22_07205 [Salinivenus sp.]
MTGPNMTVRGLERWTDTDAFAEYRLDRGHQTVDAVIRRTKRVLRGQGRPGEREKVRQFIKRHKRQSAGQRKYGSPPVSAHTAALRNWGYDPTGRFS